MSSRSRFNQKAATRFQPSRSRAQLNQETHRTFSSDGALPWFHNDKPRNDIITIAQSLYSGEISSNTVAPTYTVIAPQPDSLPQWSQLTAVFDQYRVNCLEVLLVPVFDLAAMSSGSDSSLLVSAVDLDDSALPSSQDQVREYETAVESMGHTGHYHRFVPRTPSIVYTTGLTNAKASSASPLWIDAANGNVPLYSVKTAWGTTSSVMKYRVLVKMHISFRAIH